MLMPIEICARDPAGIKMSAPVRRALKRNRIPEVFIRNRLFSSPFRPHRESPGWLLHPMNHRSNKAHRPPIAQYFTRKRA
jgi:hypothetical protein